MKQDERRIQHKIISYCREQGLKIYGTGNGQFLNTWNQIRERASYGKGLPDLVIFIPRNRASDNNPRLIFAEIKTAKGRPSKEQKEFMDLANTIAGNVHGIFVYSLQDAIDLISPLVKEFEPAVDLKQFINDL